MTYLVLVVAAVVGVLIGVVPGYKAGSSLAGRRLWFWVSVALVFALAIGVVGVALLAELQWLAVGTLGVLTGMITGMKYGWDSELRSLISRSGR